METLPLLDFGGRGWPGMIFLYMRVLIACEFSGAVRRAFRDKGHDAWSCDILPAEDGSEYHIQGDCIKAAENHQWDMAICFPPCTDLCVSGARWFKAKQASGAQPRAIQFFMDCIRLPIDRIAVENPVGIMSTKYRKPDQIIQPWQFGHGETKATCLWLKCLPELTPTNIVEGRAHRIHEMPPSENRGAERSRTYEGVARAMADQWNF